MASLSFLFFFLRLLVAAYLLDCFDALAVNCFFGYIRPYLIYLLINILFFHPIHRHLCISVDCLSLFGMLLDVV